MYDDYENDFEDFDDDSPAKSKQPAIGAKANNQYSYQPSRPNQNKTSNIKNDDDIDDYDDYEEDFEDAGNKRGKPTINSNTNSKPLGTSNKPDWLKNNNTKPVVSNVTGSKPAIGGANKNLNSYSASKPFNANSNSSRKAEAVSESRGSNSRRNFQMNPPAAVSKAKKNEYSGDYDNHSNATQSRKYKKRDFSVDNQIPKPKKINLPKDYLDKYAKNNPVRDLEKNLKSIKDNIKKLQAELADSKGIPNEHKRQKVLQRINKDLRTELKKLSESSTVL